MKSYLWPCMMTRQIKYNRPRGEWGGGVLLGILQGSCCLVLQILTLFQTKKCHFPHPFSDLTS